MEKLISGDASGALAPGDGVTSSLDSLEVKAQALCAEFEEQLWRGLDPDTASRVREANADVLELEEALNKLRSLIEVEKGAQETLLRNFNPTR